jgi:hypothetical protein
MFDRAIFGQLITGKERNVGAALLCGSERAYTVVYFFCYSRHSIVHTAVTRTQLWSKPMPFVAGDRVVWHTNRLLKRRSLRRTHDIAAEVVHGGPLRVRIRITFATGGTALRWVKPMYLRRATPERYGEPYPE